ncbi:MAG TPA: efflux RND transporter permease subunit, partial [Candidatus Saccharimonadales bacterium]|nr:efflux RND transporter permease subunit [Candidatus Saccharimonadales bacterium]
RQGVQFFVYKTSSANIDSAEQDARKTVENTLSKYNGEFKLQTVMNTATDITTQFSDLFAEFLSTVALVFILLFVFLGLRQAIIASITVPLTMLSALAIINAMGLTLNFLTTFAFLIALGLLIDDTIVTVAAMTRYYKTGNFTPYETGLMVWRDFIVPLWSTTIATIWAFLPLLLATGIIGEFIKSIPIVVTATLLSSTSIAVLITIPLMIIFLKPVFPRRVIILFRVLGILIVLGLFLAIVPKTQFTPLLVLVFVIFALVTYRVRGALRKEYVKRTAKSGIFKYLHKHTGRVLDHGLIDIERLSNVYRRTIDNIIHSKSARRKTLFAIIAFAIGGYLLIAFGFVTNEFFPKQDADVVYVSVKMPAGTNLDTTNQEALNVLNKLRKTEIVDYVVADIGQSLDTSSGNRNGDPSAILFTLHLPGHKTRNVSSSEIADRLRKTYKDYTKGEFLVEELSGGPPAGADVQIKLSGDDLSVLDKNADQLVTFLNKQPGVSNVQKSVKPGISKLVFVPDKTKLAEEDITVDTIGLQLRSYTQGFTLDTIKLGSETDDQDIILRQNAYNAQSPSNLGSISIPAGKDKPAVPLLSLGSLKLETNPTVITREKGKRTIAVSAAVAKGYSITDTNKKLEKAADDLHLPTGYSWATGGVNDENNKSVQSILQAMIISFLLILITMVVEFHSFRQALIAMMLIPLTIAGVFYVFALTGTPLSFPALIGILALFGIVVTHAIVVIEKINENRGLGIPLKAAIVDASANRLEPVLLTSLATIVGLIPITLTDPLWRGLGGAIIAGLLFSGAIKLFFVPIIYYLMLRKEGE